MRCWSKVVFMKTRLETRLPDSEFRQRWIAEAAYYLAERRHFAPGMNLDDWTRAEHAFISMLILRYQDIAQEDGRMSIQGLQRLAKAVGVERPELITTEVELIHSIQRVTGNIPSFNASPTHIAKKMGLVYGKPAVKN